MSNVYVLGAGASFGEDMGVIDEKQWRTHYFKHHNHCDISTVLNPPLISGFFAKENLSNDAEVLEKNYNRLTRLWPFWLVVIILRFGRIFVAFELSDVCSSS